MDQETDDAEQIIKYAIDYVKQNVNYDSDQSRLNIEAEIEKVEAGNEFEVAKNLCELLEVSLPNFTFPMRLLSPGRYYGQLQNCKRCNKLSFRNRFENFC